MGFEVKGKVTLDHSQMASAQRRIAAINKRIGATFKTIGRASKVAFGVVAAGAALAGRALAKGVRNALNIGSKFSDLAANTQETAGSMRILVQAFEDAGVSGEKVLPTISKLQQSVLDFQRGLSTQKDLFAILGLKEGDVTGKGSIELLDTVFNKLRGIDDIATRNAVARGLLGRSGAELGTLITNAEAISNATTTVGQDTASMLTKNADSFDRSADLLNSAGVKFESFFIGVASVVNKDLLPFLEQFNATDFSAKGKEFGEAFMVTARAIKQINDFLNRENKTDTGPKIFGPHQRLTQGLPALGRRMGGNLSDLGLLRTEIDNQVQAQTNARAMAAMRSPAFGGEGALATSSSVGAGIGTGMNMDVFISAFAAEFKTSLKEAITEGFKIE